MRVTINFCNSICNFVIITVLNFYFSSFAQDEIVYSPQSVSREAKVKDNENHVYPIDAGILKIEGIVDLQVFVDSEGNLTDIKFYRESHPTIMESAEAIVRNLEFEAAEIENKQVNSWTYLRYYYWMEESLTRPKYEEIKTLLDSAKSELNRKSYTKTYRICEEVFKKIEGMSSYYKNYAHQLEVKDRKSEAHVAYWTSMMFEEEKYLTLYYMGMVHKSIKQFKHAIDAFNAAARLAPNHPDPYRELSRIYFAKEDYENFLKNAHKAIELNPYDLRPKFNIALLYLLMKEIEKSQTLYIETINYGVKYKLRMPTESIYDLKNLLENDEYSEDAKLILFNTFKFSKDELEEI